MGPRPAPLAGTATAAEARLRRSGPMQDPRSAYPAHPFELRSEWLLPLSAVRAWPGRAWPGRAWLERAWLGRAWLGRASTGDATACPMPAQGTLCKRAG